MVCWDVIHRLRFEPPYRGEIMTCVRAASLAACLALGGCGTFYVDDTLKDVAPAERVKIADPKPVQMLFEFQTKGAHNGAGTDLLKKDVDGLVKDSGLFSTISDAPAPSGAVLSLMQCTA
jgi:hypothetical protein